MWVVVWARRVRHSGRRIIAGVYQNPSGGTMEDHCCGCPRDDFGFALGGNAAL
jgi:hypothetical protein